jgi:hypothetical protein
MNEKEQIGQACGKYYQKALMIEKFETESASKVRLQCGSLGCRCKCNGKGLQ